MFNINPSLSSALSLNVALILFQYLSLYRIIPSWRITLTALAISALPVALSSFIARKKMLAWLASVTLIFTVSSILPKHIINHQIALIITSLSLQSIILFFLLHSKRSNKAQITLLLSLLLSFVPLYFHSQGYSLHRLWVQKQDGIILAHYTLLLITLLNLRSHAQEQSDRLIQVKEKSQKLLLFKCFSFLFILACSFTIAPSVSQKISKVSGAFIDKKFRNKNTTSSDTSEQNDSSLSELQKAKNTLTQEQQQQQMSTGYSDGGLTLPKNFSIENDYTLDLELQFHSPKPQEKLYLKTSDYLDYARSTWLQSPKLIHPAKFDGFSPDVNKALDYTVKIHNPKVKTLPYIDHLIEVDNSKDFPDSLEISQIVLKKNLRSSAVKKDNTKTSHASDQNLAPINSPPKKNLRSSAPSEVKNNIKVQYFLKSQNLNWQDLPQQAWQKLEQSPRIGKRRYSKKITQLARKITQGLTSKKEKILAIQKYLKANYQYSLEVQNPKNLSAIHNFLFYEKRGQCTLFASSFALLLDSLDIPVLLQGGYAGGKLNKETNRHEFRRADAHAWAAIIIEAHGYLIVDPTPDQNSAIIQEIKRQQNAQTYWLNKLEIKKHLTIDNLLIVILILGLFLLSMLWLKKLKLKLFTQRQHYPFIEAFLNKHKDQMPKAANETLHQYNERLVTTLENPQIYHEIINYYYQIAYENKARDKKLEKQFIRLIKSKLNFDKIYDYKSYK